ncbi:AraC family transcriptional regulator [Paenibacillus sp. D9]|uniref:helix-turn-helix transcriptional regulator n=1 Tax=Paenibacillus TaxID=44249 RepID=UPI00061E1AD0|nr:MULTISPECIES: helix-turn-helix transcriptional regulator [Paenibacillus]KKC47957.1 AraC family transcriptional regulator [Paenibacillus sp. D9]
MPDTRLLTFRCPPLPFLVEARRASYEAGEEHPSRTDLGMFELIHVRRGALSVTEGDSTWTVEPGQVLLLRPDRPRLGAGACTGETEFDWVHFQFQGEWEETAEGDESTLVGDHYTHTVRLPKLIAGISGQPAAAAFAVLNEAAASADQGAFWARQQSFLDLLRQLEAAGRAGVYRASASAVAEQAAAYMKENYRESVANADLASALGYHAVYIARCMVETFGCTPQQYLLYYRLDRAKLLLLTTDWPIARVAEESGFRQTPHFSRLFAAHAGIPPHRFRKRFTP